MGSSLWDYIAWIALIGIALWVFLKVIGVIQSPLWIEYAPIYGAVYIAGWAMHKLDRATEDIRGNTHKLDRANENIRDIKEDLDKIRVECPAFKK